MPDSPHAPPAPPSPSAQVALDAADYQPYVPPPSTVPMAIMVPLTLRDPLRWLGLGWSDFMAAPGIGVFYGLCFWLRRSNCLFFFCCWFSFGLLGRFG